MRDELLPLVGEPVMVLGRLTAKETQGKLLKACIKSPRIYKWNRFETLDQIKTHRPVKTDHLWVHAQLSSSIGGPEDAMYATIRLFGHIGYYTRTNGSTDLGLMWTPCVNSVGQQIQFFYLTHKYDAVLSNIEMMEKTGVWQFCADHSSSAADNWAQIQVYRRAAERVLQTKLPVKEGSAIFL